MNSMKQDRKRLVDELDSRGVAQRQAIVTAATAHADKIRAFAEAYAAEIRRQGDLEAEQYIAQMNESPELAIFLKNIEFMRTAMAKRITYVVNGGIPGFELFFPGSAQRTGRYGIPGISSLMGNDPVAAAQDAEAHHRASQRNVLPASTETTAGDRQ
jgi:hypothetical protein